MAERLCAEAPPLLRLLLRLRLRLLPSVSTKKNSIKTRTGPAVRSFENLVVCDLCLSARLPCHETACRGVEDARAGGRRRRGRGGRGSSSIAVLLKKEEEVTLVKQKRRVCIHMACCVSAIIFTRWGVALRGAARRRGGSSPRLLGPRHGGFRGFGLAVSVR